MDMLTRLYHAPGCLSENKVGSVRNYAGLRFSSDRTVSTFSWLYHAPGCLSKKVDSVRNM